MKAFTSLRFDFMRKSHDEKLYLEKKLILCRHKQINCHLHCQSSGCGGSEVVAYVFIYVHKINKKNFVFTDKTLSQYCLLTFPIKVMFENMSS